MLFDTDIFIWVQRGNRKAARLIDRTEERYLSVYSYLELMQSAQDKKQHQYTADFLSDYGFLTLPLSENIGHRALIYIEEYSLSHGLRAGDARVMVYADLSDATAAKLGAGQDLGIDQGSFTSHGNLVE